MLDDIPMKASPTVGASTIRSTSDAEGRKQKVRVASMLFTHVEMETSDGNYQDSWPGLRA